MDINSQVNLFSKETDDANTLPNGFSLVSYRVQNLPAEAWFWLETRKLDKNALQKAYGKDNPSLRYIRVLSNGEWKEWEKI